MNVPSAAWFEIRCQNVSCSTPGGRILYRQRIGCLFSVKRRRVGVIFIGAPLVAICDCGWVWHNTDLTTVIDQASALEELGASA